MLCKGSEDLELCHEPTDEGNLLQEEQIQRKVCQKFDVPARVPASSILCVASSVRNLHAFLCVRATMHLSRAGDQSQRIIQSLDVQRIQTVFEAVQAQIKDLRLRDQKFVWSSRRSGLR